MAHNPTHTIDLDGVEVDDLLGDKTTNDLAYLQKNHNLRKGLEITSVSMSEPINPAQKLNPQRPFDPANMSEPTDLGRDPYTILTQIKEGFIDALPKWRENLEKFRRPALIGVGLLIAGLVVWVSPLDQWLGGEDVEISEVSDTGVTARGKPQAARSLEVERVNDRPDQLSEVNRQLLKNPYWALPNSLSNQGKTSVPMTAAQESRWRYGLNHRFTFQRYQAVREIRQAGLPSSAFLLFEALDQPKFWTRMEALLGLAEFGLQVDIETVERGLGDARSFLVENYFRRFLETPPGSGEIYILRQAVRIVDAKARLIILQVLNNTRDQENALYILAAKYDPSQRIQEWLGSHKPLLSANPDQVTAYAKLVQNYLTQDPSTSSESKVREVNVEELSDSNLVEEVQFFQELIDDEEDAIADPEDVVPVGFEALP